MKAKIVIDMSPNIIVLATIIVLSTAIVSNDLSTSSSKLCSVWKVYKKQECNMGKSEYRPRLLVTAH